MYVYGDIHGDWDWMRKVHLHQKNDPYAIQIGDFGIGFPPECTLDEKNLNENGKTFPPPFPETLAFIAGNHDDPDLCRIHPNCLGDYGYLEDGDIFYIRGAHSIDKQYRTISIDWWENEELAWEQFQQMVELFAAKKPRYVVSHTCPSKIFETLMIRSALLRCVPTKLDRTSEALQLALERHAPEKWFFGHFHVSSHCDVGKTRFYVIGIKQRIHVPGVSFRRTK